MSAEQTDLWQRLAGQNKPIVLYGMGNGADKILSVFSSCGIECAGVFASDGFARGNIYAGHPVESYAQVSARLSDFIVLVAFASARPEVLANIRRIAGERELYVPDVPVCGDELFDAEFAAVHRDELAAARDCLGDGRSRELFDTVIRARLDGSLEALESCCDSENDIMAILRAGEFTSFADCGAYTGDTVRALAGCAPGLSRVWALEPDRHSFARLEKYLSGAPFNSTAINAAAWNYSGELPFAAGEGRGARVSAGASASTPCVTLDSLVGEESVDYIKYDVEGAESEALRGSMQTIERCSPALRVALYHRPGDLFRLVLRVRAICPGHRLYLRRRLCIPGWDLDLIAVR